MNLIDAYFKNNSFYRLGENNYPKYRLLVNFLYYCGLRIGEALALTYNDFEKFDYYKKFDEDRPLRLVPSSDDTNDLCIFVIDLFFDLVYNDL